MKKMTKRQKQSMQTREKILSVCTELMKDHTFESMSVSLICKEAGISVGAFYHHFETKSDIIAELYRDVDDLFLSEVYPRCLDMEPLDAITEYVAAQCGHAEVLGPDIVKNIYKAQLHHATHFFISNSRGLPHGLQMLVERARSEGALPAKQDSEELLDDLLLIGRGIIYSWCVQNGDFDIADRARRIVPVFLQGLISKVQK